MNEAVILVYMIMLKESIIEVCQEYVKDSVDLTIAFRDNYGAKRYVITQLDPNITTNNLVF